MDSRSGEGPEWQFIGNLRGTNITTSSYVGNGLSGSSNPNKLAFNNKPIMIIFVGRDDLCTVSFAHCSCGKFKTPNGDICQITFSDNSVEWYGENPNSQLNEEGVTYYYAVVTEPV